VARQRQEEKKTYQKEKNETKLGYGSRENTYAFVAIIREKTEVTTTTTTK
jgi:hypothetical protein